MYCNVGTLLLERQSSFSRLSKADFILKRQELSYYSEFLPCCPGIKRRGKQSTVSSSTELKKTDFYYFFFPFKKPKKAGK